MLLDTCPFRRRATFSPETVLKAARSDSIFRSPPSVSSSKELKEALYREQPQTRLVLDGSAALSRSTNVLMLRKSTRSYLSFSLLIFLSHRAESGCTLQLDIEILDEGLF